VPGVHEQMELAKQVAQDKESLRIYAERGDPEYDEEDGAYDEGDSPPQIGTNPPTPEMIARAEKLRALTAANPRADLYLGAKEQANNFWRDRLRYQLGLPSVSEAGRRAMGILEGGGAIEEAEKALNEEIKRGKPNNMKPTENNIWRPRPLRSLLTLLVHAIFLRPLYVLKYRMLRRRSN
jgi:hypothetical protein